MRSKRRVPDSQLQELVDRLFQSKRSEADAPVIISTAEGDYRSSVGRLLAQKRARLSALVDVALERERAVTVFLPADAYVGEVTSCESHGDRFTVELVLIQQRDRDTAYWSD